MIHGHSNTRRKTYLWQEAITYACMISNNMPHKIRGEWHSPQIEMFGKLIDLSYFQLFGSTCHVLIQEKGHMKLEAKTKKAIFTGMDRNSGGAWRYLALLDRAIQMSQKVYFPRHLLDPSSSDEPPPLSIAEDADTLNPEKWIQVFAPSEGEMGNKPHIATNKPDLKHTHTPGASTQHEDSFTNKSTNTPAQGEHLSAPSNTLTSSKESTKLVRTTDRSEHAH
jgi:hypothetical protein